MLKTPRSFPLVLALLAALTACEDPTTTTPRGLEGPGGGSVTEGVEQDVLQRQGLLIVDGEAAVAATFREGQRVIIEPAPGELVREAALRFDSREGDPALRFSVERDGVWSDWQSVEVTYMEGGLYTARVALDEPGTRLALSSPYSAAGGMSFFYAELGAPHGDEAHVDAEPAAAGDGLRTQTHAIAPAELVNPRSAWGARNTGTCGSAHNPNYITIHHTVTPTNDSFTPEERLRQIQAFHIDSRGWCDVGYHFLVSADGRVWQGRADEERTGSHVGNHNTNNVGVSFMGSFHIDQVPDPMIVGTAPIVRWLSDTYAIPLNRTYVLGHREWSGASTACPGQFLFDRLQELIDLAANPGPPADETVDISVAWNTIQDQPRDFVATGSSAGVFDVLEAQTFEGVITVRNGADRPATDSMILGYWIESPYLRPVSYRIEHDRPAHDGQTWVTSPAHGGAANDPVDAPAASGNLNVGVVEPGESVRVTFVLEAVDYSFGAVDHPDLRAWVKHIGSYYGEQDGWNDDVEVNLAGRLLRAYAQSDVFSRDRWYFNGPDGEDLEGWGILNEIEALAINITDGALASKSSGLDPHIGSPTWTAIDADITPAIEIVARQHAGPRDAKLYWARAGESYDEARSLVFQTAGGGEFETLAVDLSQHPEWSGLVVALRIDQWHGTLYEGAEAWLDIDSIDARPTAIIAPPMDPDPGMDAVSSSGDATSSGADMVSSSGGADGVSSSGSDGGNDDASSTDASSSSSSSGGEDAGTQADATTPDDPTAGSTEDCACAVRRESPGGEAPLGLLLLLGLVGLARQRVRRG